MKQITCKPTIKPRQTDILILLYRFRFLNRSQIQIMLGHKYHSRIGEWLNELVILGYVNRDYDKKLTSSKAIYYLTSLGRKYLKERPNVQVALLSRVWREKNYTDGFRERCILLANIYTTLLTLATSTKATLYFKTKVDLYGLEHLINPAPDAYIAICEESGLIKRYFLEVFDDLPPKILRKRISQYLKYFDSDEWQGNTDKPFPKILIVCPSGRMKNHLYYYIQSKLRENSDLTFFLTTKDIIENQGFRKEALQKVKTES